jgi:RNA polymerase sigma factor (sigma-70 family)
MFDDEVLCKRFKEGDSKAFSLLKNKYNKLIYTICKQTFEAGSGDIHEQMSVNYLHTMEEVVEEVWLGLSISIQKGIKFDHKFSFVNLLRTVTKNKTINVKNKSVKNRNKYTYIKGASNKFRSMNSEEGEYLENLLFDATQENSTKGYADNSEKLSLFGTIEKEEHEQLFWSKLENSLEGNELLIFKMMQTSLKEQDKNVPHKEIATKLEVSERTVRNKIISIRAKAKSIFDELDVI